MAEAPLEEEEREILSPPTDLRKKVRVLSKRETKNFDPVKAAEQALERLSGKFDGWMSNETNELTDAYDTIRAEGLTKANLETLYQAVHNMKGQALTLGYPLVGSVASSFCRLLEHVPSPDKLPLSLTEQYVEAIRAMVAEGARDTDNSTGAALADRLSEVTEDYLAQFPAKGEDDELMIG